MNIIFILYSINIKLFETSNPLWCTRILMGQSHQYVKILVYINLHQTLNSWWGIRNVTGPVTNMSRCCKSNTIFIIFFKKCFFDIFPCKIGPPIVTLPYFWGL